MATGRRRRTIGAAALSVAAHLAVLVAAALQVPTLRMRPEAEAPPPTVIPVFLIPRAARPAARAVVPIRPRRPSQRPAPDALPVAPLPAAPSPGPPAAVPAAGPDLAGVLRRGAVGCANAGAVGLSRAERERCEARLAAGAKDAKHLWGMEPAKREYYAAVAEAKAPDAPVTQGTALGRVGGQYGLDSDMRGMKGHLPYIGCKVHFGRGYKPPNAPPHALKLGPCFIEPPAGSLSPDVDIPPP